MAGYSFTHLIREFCDSFEVIIPFKALSCATLIALGADNIIMSKMGQLSPIDPSVYSPLGPIPQKVIPISESGPTPVSVEDAIGYLDLAKEQGLQGEESLTKVFEELSKNVHPLVLGQVFRTRQEFKESLKKSIAKNINILRKLSNY